MIPPEKKAVESPKLSVYPLSMEIVLATGNPHKAAEMQEIFKNHRILIPGDLGVGFEFAEDGSTFLENSLGKALALYRMVKRPVIADDSGLCVDILDGAPGVYSARFGSIPGAPELASPERNALLLETMKFLEPRTARFVCALALVLDEYRIFTIQESVEGEILQSPRGAGGFGYDPLFYMPPFGRTMAELTPEEKNRHSHRGKAGRTMAALLDEI